MTPYFYSCCGNSNVVLKETKSGKNIGRKYYACPNAKVNNQKFGVYIYANLFYNILVDKNTILIIFLICNRVLILAVNILYGWTSSFLANVVRASVMPYQI